MASPVCWALLALIVAVVVWWAGQVDWSAWYALHHAAFDRDRRATALLVATTALWALQGAALQFVVRDVAVASIATRWLPAAILLALAYYYWHRS